MELWLLNYIENIMKQKLDLIDKTYSAPFFSYKRWPRLIETMKAVAAISSLLCRSDLDMKTDEMQTIY